MLPTQCYKLIKTGGVFEFYIAQTPFNREPGKEKYNDEPRELPWEFRVLLEAMAPDIKRSEEYQARSAFRARNNIRRLVQTNFNKDSRFITLTFRDTEEFDIHDPKSTHPRFKSFIERLRYKYGDFHYVAVPEFQEKNGRHAVHYHMVCDLPFIQADDLAAIWGLGFIKINFIRNSSRVGYYVSKYLTKQSYAPQLTKFRKYFYSKNLQKATVVYGEKALELYNKLSHTYQPHFTSKYESLYNGIIEHIEFVMYREEVIKRESIFNGYS